MVMDILCFNDSQPVRFAVKELRKYLQKITGDRYKEYLIENNDMCSLKKYNRCILIGTFDKFRFLDRKKNKFSFWDDAIFFKSINGKLIISGSNDRSVLFSVYTFLEALGIRWISPDKEHIPQKIDFSLEGYNFFSKADFRYRSVCFALPAEPGDFIKFIDWATKKRFNEFYLQVENLGWLYRNICPDIMQKEIDIWDDKIIMEIKKRGAILGKVGHGWYNESLDIKFKHWGQKKVETPEKIKKYLSEVNGVREITHGEPLRLNMCLSNKEGIKKVIKYVIRYVRKHPEIDILGFWVPDSLNNDCECKSCRKLTPTDWYLRLAKKIAESIRRINSSMKVEIIGYANSMFPPVKEYVDCKNQYKNMILSYAPFNRCFNHTLMDENCNMNGSPVRKSNRMIMPRNREYYKYLSGWLSKFNGECILFDYHLCSNHFHDFMGENIPYIINKELRELKKRGIAGVTNCIGDGLFFPDGLAMDVLAANLWNCDEALMGIRENYFKQTYGGQVSDVTAFYDDYYKATADTKYSHNYPPDDVKIKKILAVLKKYIPVFSKKLKRLCLYLKFLKLRAEYLYAEYHTERMAMVNILEKMDDVLERIKVSEDRNFGELFKSSFITALQKRILGL